MNMISVNHGSKAYHGQPILNDINLAIPQGQVIGLIGKSGSGKSTLLQCLSQLEHFDGGQTQLFGELVHHNSGKEKTLPLHLKKKIGLIFQDYCLWSHMTVLDNLILAPVHTLKMDKDVATKLALDMLEKLNMHHKASAYPNALSGGQKQRVAIARCLMMSPELILMDEPTAALDPSATKDLIQIIKDLKASGMTIVIASHEIGFIQSIADQVLFMHEGHITESGSVDIIKNPTTEAFKAFTQTMLYD